MFTGIVQAVGRIAVTQDRARARRLTIEAKRAFRGSKIGDSIAVSGVCLTAGQTPPDRFVADVSAETLKMTTAGKWRVGTRVNLEKALTPATPLGGHLVSGHVDGVGKVISIGREGASRRLRIENPRALSRYVARKGSVCVDRS